MNVKTEIMRFFSSQFETRNRDNGETFNCLVNNAPEWCTDVVLTAHGDMLPDDYRYKWISQGADSLADIEPEEWEESIHEIADGLTDVYNGELLNWLSSNLTRAEYINEYVSNAGIDSDNFDFFPLVMAGQYQEITETLQALISEIESLADDVEPFSAGFNMCGYMPDSEPLTFPDFESAKDYILDELTENEETKEENGNDEAAQLFRGAWCYVNKQNELFSVTVNGLAFWVSVSDTWMNEL